MSFPQLIVLFVLAFVLISLYFEIIGAAFTFILGVVFLGLTGILTSTEILAGFSNEPMLLVIMLLLIGEVIRKTGAISGFFETMMNRAKTTRGFIFKVITPMAGVSAFINNTPLVAIMIPFVQTWTQKMRISSSKLMIPLSFGIILGGNVTLIGTSNNLIVNSLVHDQKIIPGFETLSFFDFAWVGVPMMIIGIIYLWLVSDKLLPSREPAIERFSTHQREYMVEAIIKHGSHLIGQTISESGLLELKGLSLMEIRSVLSSSGLNVLSSSSRIPSTDPTYLLTPGDILIFTGNTNSITELIDHYDGIAIQEIGMFAKKEHLEVVEVVVSHNSPLASKTVREIRFRQRYGAVVLGIHRNGEKLMEKTADIKIRPGDVILLLADPGIRFRTEESGDFYHLQQVRQIQKPGALKSLLILGGLVLVIALSVIGLIKLIMGVAVYLMILLLTKIANPKEVFKSLDYNLGLIIVMTLALGTAMYKTGLAEMFAWSMIDLMRPFGLAGVLAGLYLTTAIIAAYVNNKAALTLVFPVALLTAHNLNLNPLPFALLTASASMGVFITPHGYQTNLMIYGPGGYRFKDFLPIGLPLTVVNMIVAIAVLYFVYFFKNF
ncbi:MAG: SLC13 family permease [Porphyromonadaceae bacterium]|nr:MAG: SLC13 family permease [Porphyromonadaceae bacterium]